MIIAPIYEVAGASLVLALLGKAIQYLHFAAHSKKVGIMSEIDSVVGSILDVAIAPQVEAYKVAAEAGKVVNVTTYIDAAVTDALHLMGPSLQHEILIVTHDVEGFVRSKVMDLFHWHNITPAQEPTPVDVKPADTKPVVDSHATVVPSGTVVDTKVIPSGTHGA